MIFLAVYIYGSTHLTG